MTPRPCVRCAGRCRSFKHKVWWCSKCETEVEREAVRVALADIRKLWRAYT